MMHPLYYYAVGYSTLATHGEHAADLLEICRRGSWVYSGFRNHPDGGISMTFPRRVAISVQAEAEACGIPVTIMGGGGLPDRVKRILKRPGLVIGCILGLCLYIAGTQVVWDIRISGNTTVSDRAIEDTLATCGFTVGTPLRGFRADVLENQVLLSDDRLAWISVNRRGTVAYVEVREATHTPPPESESPADLVAAIGGIIQRVELEEGNVRVSAGQTVSEGEVLVSGIYDSMTQGIRLARARARIYARTTRELTVTIPLTYEYKTYLFDEDAPLSEISREKFLKFFKKSIKFSKKTGNDGVLYDIIEGEMSMGPVSGVGFPISVRTVWYLPYAMTTATRTYAEAEELAYVELAQSIAALPGGAELLSKSITIARAPDALILQCTLTCVEDIGTVREIGISITES